MDRRSPSYYDDLVEEALRTGQYTSDPSRSNLLQITTTNNSSNIRIGNILSLLSTSFRRLVLLNENYLSWEVAAYLAAVDFNRRQTPYGTVFPEDCNLYLTTTFRDAALSPIYAAREWTDAFLFDDETNTTALPSFAVVGPISTEESLVIATVGGVSNVQDGLVDSSESTAIVQGGGFVGSERGILNLSPSAASTELDDTNLYPYFGRTMAPNSGDAQALMIYLQSIGVKRVAIFHVNNSYGTTYATNVRAAGRRYRMHVSSFAYQVGDAPGLVNAMEQVEAGNFVYHVGIFDTANWQQDIAQLYNHGLIGIPEKVWFLSTTAGAVSKISLPKDHVLVKALNYSSVVALEEPVEHVRIQQEALQNFTQDDAMVRHFLDRHIGGLLANDELPLPYEDLLPRLVGQSILTMLTYDAVLALGLAVCQTGMDFPDTPAIFEAMKAVEFMGAHGHNAFDAETGSRQTEGLGFRINTYTPEPSVDDPENAVYMRFDLGVIVYGGSERIESHGPIYFPDGSTMPYGSVPNVTENKNLIPIGVIAFCSILAALTMAASIYFAVWTWRKRTSRAVLSSQPFFLVALCVGTFLMSLSIVPTVWQEPLSQELLNVGCMLDIWLVSLGFSTTFAALFSKIWRINQVYKSAKSFRRVVIRIQDVLWPFAIIASLNLIILISWTIVDPFVYKRVIVEVDIYDQVLESRGTCYDDLFGGSAQTYFGSTLLLVNFLGLLVTNIQSIRARKLPKEFNESRNVARTNFILLEATMLGFPFLFLVYDDPLGFVVVRSLIVVVFVTGIIFPLFAPLMDRRRRAELQTSGPSSRRIVMASTRLQESETEGSSRTAPPRSILGSLRVSFRPHPSASSTMVADQSRHSAADHTLSSHDGGNGG